MKGEEAGDWVYLRRELKRRTFQPCRHAPFVIYVIVSIVILGGLGIWVEVLKFISARQSVSFDGLLTAMATFSPALVGSASIQLALVATGSSDRILTSFATLVLVSSFASVILIWFSYSFYPMVALACAIILVIFSVWLWWITNGDDPTYKKVSIDTASGGDTSRELSGDTSGFKVE